MPKLSAILTTVIFLLLAVPGVFTSFSALATENISLKWDASPENDVAGYFVYLGTTPGVYNSPQDAGLSTTYTTTNAQQGTTYYFVVTAYDTGGNESGPSNEISIFIPPPPDTTRPSSPVTLQATELSPSQITLTWASSTDDVGVTGYRVYRDGRAIGTTVNLTYLNTGLAASTTYTYSITAFDAADNESSPSSAVSATTLAPPDTTPPIVSLTVPVDGATVTGTVPISAIATDNVGVRGVQFQLNGANLGLEDTTNTYSVSWDTTTIEPGTYSLTAIARDTAGNTTTTGPVSVTVANTVEANGILSLMITNLKAASGKPYEVASTGLLPEAMTYIDRSYTYTTIPAYLQNATYLKTANDDKDSSGVTFLTFDVNQPVTVYVAHDERITTKPAWLNAFTALAETVDTTDTSFALYAKSFPAGSITLGGNDDHNTFNQSMYTVAVVPPSGIPALTSPAPKSVLPSDTVTFSWAANGAPVPEWWLYVGTSLGGKDLHDSGSLGTRLSTTVSRFAHQWQSCVGPPLVSALR